MTEAHLTPHLSFPKPSADGEFYLMDIEQELAGENAEAVRSQLIGKYTDQLQLVIRQVQQGLDTDEYSYAVAWRAALETATRVISEVRPRALPVTESNQ